MSRTIPPIGREASPAEILRIGIEAAGGPVALACSFSMEDVAIIDIANRAGIALGVFAIDTGRLPEETFEVAEALVERYRLQIDWYFPKHEEIQRLASSEGLYSFRESLEKRHACCAIRKVEPLARALAGLAGWVTGIRREQGVTRSNLAPMELDELNGGILKINPLVDWSEEQLLAYTAEHRLPKNRLYDKGYRSIGCAPCTRAVRAGEDARAGRWWWENPDNKECGLHRR